MTKAIKTAPMDRLANAGPPNSEEFMWIESITADPVVMHRITTSTIKNRQDYYTHCGKEISFRTKSPLIPRKHARKFAINCEGCGKPNVA